MNEGIALAAFNVEYYLFLAALLGSNIVAQTLISDLTSIKIEVSNAKRYWDYILACSIPIGAVVGVMALRKLLRYFAKSKYVVLRAISYLQLILGFGLKSTGTKVVPTIPYHEAVITNVFFKELNYIKGL